RGIAPQKRTPWTAQTVEVNARGPVCSASDIGRTDPLGQPYRRAFGKLLEIVVRCPRLSPPIIGEVTEFHPDRSGRSPSPTSARSLPITRPVHPFAAGPEKALAETRLRIERRGCVVEHSMRRETACQIPRRRAYYPADP